jgi:predicted nucleic acid-binding protein
LIVLDAGAAVAYLAVEPAGQWVEEQIHFARVARAPHLIDFEIASALRGLVRRHRLTQRRAVQALLDLNELRLIRYPARDLLDRIWVLRETLTAYDASYVALAELLRIPLVTTDERLARSGGHNAEILTPAS